MQSLLCASVSDWDVIKDIIIPLVCALFGGLVTFIGIFITIKHENKKSRQDYTDRIRPFIVIESALTTKADLKQTIDVVVHTNAENEEEKEGASVYRFQPFLFTNCGEAVFIVDYLAINNRHYECIHKTPIKPSETAQMRFYPERIIQTDGIVKSIHVGVSDRRSNKYEYELLFEVGNNKADDSLKKICKEYITIKSIDCRKNLNKRTSKKKKPNK